MPGVIRHGCSVIGAGASDVSAIASENHVYSQDDFLEAVFPDAEAAVSAPSPACCWMSPDVVCIESCNDWNLGGWRRPYLHHLAPKDQRIGVRPRT